MELLKIYSNLYVSESLEKKKRKVLRKIKKHQFVPDVYLITLAENKEDELEFYSSLLWKQYAKRNIPIFLVGLAKGYEEALDLITQITQEVHRETGEVEIRKYISDRENN